MKQSILMIQAPLFYEVQDERNLWMTVFLIVINLLLLFLITKKDQARNKVYLIGTGFGLLVTLAATILFLTLKQYTEIKTDGVYVKLFPLQISYRYYPWKDIEKSYVRVYNPIREYGGWGLRGRKHNRAINQSGNDGLQLLFKDGTKLLIGTQKPKDIAATLTQLNRYVK